MEASYAWGATLSRLDDLMDSLPQVRENPAAAHPARTTMPEEATP